LPNDLETSRRPNDRPAIDDRQTATDDRTTDVDDRSATDVRDRPATRPTDRPASEEDHFALQECSWRSLD
jgi:hypothetical protein